MEDVIEVNYEVNINEWYVSVNGEIDSVVYFDNKKEAIKYAKEYSLELNIPYCINEGK